MRCLRGLWMAIILILVGVGFSAERERFSEKEYLGWKKALRAFEKEINGDFFLEGVVMDERGNLLKGVKLRISTHYASWDDWDFAPSSDKTDTREKIINGTFSLKIKNRASVYLEFSKEGYYDERLHFSFDPPEGGKREGRTLVNRNIKVVLERIGELPKLIEFDSALVYYSSRKAIIINFDNLGGPGTVVGTRGREKVEDLLFAIEGGTLPPNSIYILPRIDARGKVIPIIDEYNRYFAPPTKLVMNDPEGGFVIHKPKRKLMEVLSREMKEAPEEGYVREIMVDDTTLGEKRRIFFFFKTGEMYGKGYLSPPYLFTSKKEGYLVEMAIHLFLNPTGSRNVRTK